MAWDFETEPEYQLLLDWADAFVHEEVEPLDLILRDPFDKSDQVAMGIVRPLQAQVRDRGLWACHLGPELGGQGFGQLKLALLNEILGRSKWAPSVFGCQAPDSGNAEILAHYGSDEQRAKYLQPLLDGEISSSYAMTEPTAGADPTLFTSRAVRDGGDWVINGEKWFASNARQAEFFITMVVTRPEAERSRDTMSMFIVPADTPGIEIVRNIAVGPHPPGSGSHGYLRFTNVRVPADHLLGEDGGAFAISQVRLGGGRVHHAMRTVGQIRRVFDLLCERAVSRKVRGGTLSTFQMTQEKIADSWIEMEQFRLLVLRTAWMIDRYKDYKRVRKDIAAVKVLTPKVLHDVLLRAMQLHGSLGVSNEMPFGSLFMMAVGLGIADGPTEVHKLTLARQILKGYKPRETPWPSGHLPTRRAEAEARFADLLELEIASE
jgi:acyl-CoA dehydrogenase